MKSLLIDSSRKLTYLNPFNITSTLIDIRSKPKNRFRSNFTSSSRLYSSTVSLFSATHHPLRDHSGLLSNHQTDPSSIDHFQINNSSETNQARDPTRSSGKSIQEGDDGNRRSSPGGSISESEIDHFDRLSNTWWNESDSFGLLHRMNPVRVRFIKDRILKDYSRVEGDESKTRFLRGLRVLDVGCGGGILSEVLHRLGGEVLGIDASSDAIRVAQNHLSLQTITQESTTTLNNLRQGSQDDGPSPGLRYLNLTVEQLLDGKDQERDYAQSFDLVCSMEVLEHVQNPSNFLNSLIDLTRPGGHLILSTISRTPLSKLLTITMAENLMGIVPKSTHTYSKFIKPIELEGFFRDRFKGKSNFGSERNDLEVRGTIYNPLTGRWSLLSRDSIGSDLCNYFIGIKKPA
ncbi:3-demethylubiquinone-9 3-methyltransferase [Phakopsora pachyrhizi]|uniref:Ubiquinone biosynthesis O-methyltransferase, mitochondrial n=1 Tax=Phakopsora pachyrhizi TaxID=170000 RepID=A0AAV0BWM7_PHAPC|nr:3-demethylubiquinone-9 3-methyltransferase [Phakopsora pachyrhizi]CAH7690674.1 3-demethylubiquinone-9 3-methyltransferase [Phakopsora pachyrhizi]